MTQLFLDLDGVFADFDRHFSATFGVNHKTLADAELWTKINAHPSYFYDIPVMEGSLEFFEKVVHLRPIFLTACPKSNYEHVAVQKKRWVEKNVGRGWHVLPVIGGRNKKLFMKSQGDILIDDWDKNIITWNDFGGRGWLHTGDFSQWIKNLQEEGMIN